MQEVKLQVFWVDRKGFHYLETVTLKFPDDIGTFPLPKGYKTEKALEEQRPDVFQRIPTFEINGFSYRRGLYFERVN